MRLSLAAASRDAWALFRRDRDLLVRVAGPFLFLPALAIGLLVPGIPAPDPAAGDSQAQAAAWLPAFGAWANAHAGWYLLAGAVGQGGTAAIYALYLQSPRPTLGEALRRGVTLLPRLLLAQALVGIAVFAGLMLWLLPGLFLLARALPVGPVLVAERGRGVPRAIARGFALGRGATLPLMTLVAVPYAAAWLAEQPLLALDRWMRGTGLPNPVALGIVEAGVAGVAAAAGLAQALLALVAYRRLASNGH